MIEEEQKFLSDYLPSQEFEASPYFRNCILQDQSSHKLTLPSSINDESVGKKRESVTNLVFYENKHSQSLDDDKIKYL